MKILFIHQGFPGQFKCLAPALVALGHDVIAMTMQRLSTTSWHGVRIVSYVVSRGSSREVHPWVGDFETKVIRAEACFLTAKSLAAQGFYPDIIISHPGWGESLFIKEAWPRAKLGIYCEFFYHAYGVDANFDPEFSAVGTAESCRIKLKNVNNLMHFDIADAGISPTRWQASTFPEPFRSKISVIHDGIDTQALTPNSDAVFEITTPAGAQLRLTRNDQVITFVNRNLEPYRGYHTFMRALPAILRQNPEAVVLIVGGDGVSYGAKPPGEKTWKEIFRAEVENQIADKDWARVHYLGNIAYSHFVAMLRISSAHVYLTYPFVLSWSLLEAMSVGCAIVASNTAPLREAIVDQQTGRLVDFFDHVELARTVSEVLANPSMREALGKNARAFACAHYDLQTVCLPRQLQWVEQWAR